MEIKSPTLAAPLSEEQMMELFSVDRKTWIAQKLSHNVWTTTIKNNAGEVIQVPNYQTTILFKRNMEHLVEIMVQELQQTLLSLQPQQHKHIKEQGNLGGIMFTDLHLNALDIDGNTFNKRVHMINERMKRTIDRLLRFDPQKLLISNLGDMNNSDIGHKTTSQETHMQDTVSMIEGYKRILERELFMLEYMKQYGLPIKYIKLPGNHDHHNTLMSAVALQQLYKDEQVLIDYDENRYYEIRGNTLIALSHGDRGDGARLFQMIVDECITKIKKKIEHMYAYLGHVHRNVVNQQGPLEIRSLQAPLPKTAWSKRNGIDVKQSMSGFVWHYQEGQIVEVRG